MMTMLRRFTRDTQGATALIFGVTLIPIVLAAGAAVDYSRGAASSSAVQNAVDATALLLARDAGAGLSDAQLQALGQQVFTASMKGQVETTFAPLTVTRDPRTITVTASGSMKTAFMKIARFDEMQIAASSSAAWGVRKIEIAMVLDNTGSMKNRLGSGVKMDRLKEAAHQLLNDSQAAAPSPDAIKLSIVPFDTQVNVKGLVDTKTMVDFTIPKHVDGRGKVIWEGAKEKNWTGCVMDREESSNWDVRDDAPIAGQKGSLYPAVVCANGGALAAIQPLTSDYKILHAAVDRMTPSGNTNITIGTIWGLASLSSAAPLTQAEPYGTPNVEKYMIMLSDGDNTENRGTGETNYSPPIDARTRKACTAVKDKSIKLYTLLVGSGNAALLKDCAGNGGWFRQVDNAQDISASFRSILNDILALRLTH